MALEVKRIMCCCGQGLGSSMIVAMNVEKALKNIGVSGVKVEHTALSEITKGCAELFVVGKDLAPQVEKFETPMIVLEQLMNMQEIESKLKEVFGK